MKRILFCVYFSFTAFAGKAASCTFTGNADGVSWHLAGNWSCGNVPGPTDMVYISSGQVELSTTATIAYLYLKDELLITSSGNLTVNGETDVVLGSSALLTISGVMTQNNGGISIDQYTSMLVRTGGELFVNNSPADGIFCEGSLRVNISGLISVTDPAQAGVYLRGGLINNGRIETEGGINGLYLNAFNTTDSLENNQLLVIRNSTGYGIQMLGSILHNADRLLIENSGDYSIYSQVTGGKTSMIRNTSGARLIARNGIKNNIQFIENSGYMYLEDYTHTVLETGYMTNSDTLIVSCGVNTAIDINKNLTNESSGVILSDSLGNAASFGGFMIGAGTLINRGIIDLDMKELRPGIVLSSNFSEVSYNSGLIKIRNSITNGFKSTARFFVNESGGIIEIDQAQNLAFTMQGNSTTDYTFQNYGTLKVNNQLSGTGLIISSFSTFHNLGTIELENFEGLLGIDVYSDSLINHSGGIINIKNKGSLYGFKNENTFLNDGILRLYQQGTSGKALQNTGQLTNKGEIYIYDQNSISGESLIENTFLNDTCGYFRTEWPVKVNSGVSFINYGFLSFNKKGKISSGFVSNYGVVESLDSLVDYTNYAVNEGIITNPWNRALSSGYTYGAPVWCHPSFTAVSSSWYSDKVMTSLKGNFDPANSTLAVTSAAASEELYIPVDFYGKCTRTLTVPLNDGILFPCNFIREVDFTGAMNNNWLQPINWSNQLIPVNCTRVTISATSKVLVHLGQFAEAKSLETLPGAVLEVEAGGILEVDLKE